VHKRACARLNATCACLGVIPAKAGIHSAACRAGRWVPAFAGTTF
jgi:hypothetical protein